MVKSSLVVTLILFCLLPCSQGQVPSSRTVDWTRAGIPGGIPSANWPICQTISPSGGADDSVTIQNAIASCAAGSVVKLKAGTFTLHRSSRVCPGLSDDGTRGVFRAGLCLNKGVVLRGSGPDQTVLNYGDGASIVSLGLTFLSSSQVVATTVTSGATKGSTQLKLSSTSGLSVGSFIVVSQTNPTDPADGNPLVSVNGYGGACNYCGHDLPNSVMTQIEKITAVNGTTITVEIPLYFDYTNGPFIYPLTMVQNAGLEDLRLQPTASSGSGGYYKNIDLESCAYCWVHNVETDKAVDLANIYLSDVYSTEISNNYLNDGYNHNSGLSYGIYLVYRASNNLVQNNIIRKARHSTPTEGGSSGNVFAYNYAIDPYMGEYPNSLPETQSHGAHSFMNLYEGNVYPNIEFDFTHGSASHHTIWRNYVNLTSTNPNTGSLMTGAIFAFADAYYSNYLNVLGNVFGQYPSGCTATKYEINADDPQNPSIYKLGYYDDGGTTCPNKALCSKVGKTILRGGNWDCTTGSVVWNNNVPPGSLTSTYLPPQTLPNSLYLSGKPSWFIPTSAVWPPVDPAASTKVNKIPAQLCYESGVAVGKAFTPSSCYEGAAPAPPSNLTAIAQ
jgi:hypothetical protein